MRFPMPISSLPEHKIGVFVRFWGLEPLFSGFSSTKSRFLCAFGCQSSLFQVSRAQNCHFCAHLLNWMLGWGTFPPPEASAHLRSRCTCAAAVPSAIACSRLPPVPPLLPLLPPLHLRSRRTCAAAVPAAVACRSSLPPSHLPVSARAG